MISPILLTGLAGDDFAEADIVYFLRLLNFHLFGMATAYLNDS
jgi:hypothetical protein